MPPGQHDSATVEMQKRVGCPTLGGVGLTERLLEGNEVCVQSRKKRGVSQIEGCVDGFIW